MTMRGWSSVGLVLVDEHERLWTVAEAARFLDEPADDVRWLIRRLRIPAAGLQQQTGTDKRGRQPRTYRAVDLIKAFDALSYAACRESMRTHDGSDQEQRYSAVH